MTIVNFFFVYGIIMLMFAFWDSIKEKIGAFDAKR